MRSLAIKIMTAWRLGVVSILRALFYRFSLRLGWNPVKRLAASRPLGPFFMPPEISEVDKDGGRFFDSEVVISAFGLPVHYSSNGFPNWHESIISGAVFPKLPWWELSDFSDAMGDIKGVWEVSRFDWVLLFVQQALTRQAASIDKVNAWLQDWSDNNPPYIGVNWKCGQEVSIRVMHLAMAAYLLDQEKEMTPGLQALIHSHLTRIAPTLQYAIAQNNNHGTSEASALFIGGSWLAQVADDDQSIKEAKRWMKKGRKWLENRALKLIEPDGTFSQYSLNYHRVMLDTYSMAELWRSSLGLPEFSGVLIKRVQAATAWLGNMVSPDGTDAPNLGANDGARLLPLAETDYRDVRPSVQLASVLFAGRRAYENSGPWDDALKWLRIAVPEHSQNYCSSYQYDDGGFAVLRDRSNMVLFRYPCFRFRPGQSDLLHVDFWLGEVNLLRDAGSYSYNCEEPWQSYFPGVAAHNTVQFDGRDAMPRLSRFLFGAWPKAHNVKRLAVAEEKQTVSAGYCDWKGASHHRAIVLTENGFSVTDEVGGFKKSAVLRWRLAPGEWCWDGEWLVGSGVRLRVTGTQSLKRRELVEGWESRYYSRKTALPVLEIEVEEAGRLTTELRY